MREDDPPRLYSHDEWAGMTPEQRERIAAARRRDVELARAAHAARQRLLDSLTVERFGHQDTP